MRGLGLTAMVQADGTRLQYVTDGHGDVKKLISSSGAVVADYTYDAFGNQTEEAEDSNPFRYAGEYWDKETGLIYLRARYYDAGIGSFTQEDPARDGENWYVYCGGNPILYVDPSGLLSYIFYTTGQDSDFTSQAQWQKERLENMGEEVIMIEVKTSSDFAWGWNNMGNGRDDSTTEINYVMIYSHGDNKALIFESGSSTNAMSVNGLNSAGNSIRNVNDLYYKNVKELNLLSCNGGHVGVYDMYGLNLASVFSTRISGTTVAYDGNVSFGRPIWDIFGEDIGKSSRLATNQNSFWDLNRKTNRTSNPFGKVYYRGGKRI